MFQSQYRSVTLEAMEEINNPAMEVSSISTWLTDLVRKSKDNSPFLFSKFTDG